MPKISPDDLDAFAVKAINLSSEEANAGRERVRILRERLEAKVKAEPEHIAHVRASFTGARIRPEEVAGAAIVWNKQAVKCQPAEAASLGIIAKLDECCPEGVPVMAAGPPISTEATANLEIASRSPAGEPDVGSA